MAFPKKREGEKKMGVKKSNQMYREFDYIYTN